MKKNSHFLMLVLTIFTVILSACGGTTIPVTGSGGAVQTLPAAFIAVVESITDDQWTISGQTVTIDPGVVSGGPFNTGDLVKVEVVVNQDGSFTISSVETPSVEDLSTLPRLGDGADNANNNNNANSNENTNINSNDNTNSANSNEANGNVNNNVNSNDNVNNANSNDNTNSANSNDNNSNDANSNDDNDNENGNDNDDNGDGNDNDSSGPGSGGDDNGGNDHDSNDNG